MNRYPIWKNLLVLVVIVLGAVVALPNVFGKDPAIQVSRADGEAMQSLVIRQRRECILQGEVGSDSAASIYADEGRVVVRFDDGRCAVRGQGPAARGAAGEGLCGGVLTLAPRTPDWLREVGLEPMSLGLDLRGGVHFLFEVDVDAGDRPERLQALCQRLQQGAARRENSADGRHYQRHVITIRVADAEATRSGRGPDPGCRSRERRDHPPTG